MRSRNLLLQFEFRIYENELKLSLVNFSSERSELRLINFKVILCAYVYSVEFYTVSFYCSSKKMNFSAKIGRNIVLTILHLKPETTIKLHDSSEM